MGLFGVCPTILLNFLLVRVSGICNPIAFNIKHLACYCKFLSGLICAFYGFLCLVSRQWLCVCLAASSKLFVGHLSKLLLFYCSVFSALSQFGLIGRFLIIAISTLLIVSVAPSSNLCPGWLSTPATDDFSSLNCLIHSPLSDHNQGWAVDTRHRKLWDHSHA